MSDVIVVLGAAPLADGRPGPAMERRVARGVELYREGRAHELILSGGPVRHSEPEADIMARLARELGVPEARLLRERRSANTFENAVYTQLIMEERGFSRALVVTDSFHLPRALFIFRTLGMTVQGAAAGRGAEARWRWYGHHVRETAAVAKSAGLFLLGRHKPVIARARREG